MMDYITYDICFGSAVVAELSVPETGCYWNGIFVSGPNWPDSVTHESGYYLKRQSLIDSYYTDEDSTEWDMFIEDIMDGYYK